MSEFTGNVASITAKKLNSGKTVHEINLGVRQGKKEEPTTLWVNASFFAGKVMKGRGDSKTEATVEDIQKGDLIRIVGDVSVNPYLDKEGKPKASLQIVSGYVEILFKKGESSGGAGGSSGQRSSAGQDDFEDDIPF